MTDLVELAKRVEAATGPDRRLDVEIAVAVDWRWDDWEEGESTARDRSTAHGLEWLIDRATNGMNSMWRGIPRYTASLDASMTLVGYPNGRPHNVVIASAYGSAYIIPNDGESYGVNDPLKGEGRAIGDDELGRTARAVTAAALRALAAQGEG